MISRSPEALILDQHGKPMQFDYAAIQDKGRRAAPKTRIYHEGEVLTPTKRRKMQATTQDQNRNISLVAWMVRKHLDYVSKFHFSFRTNRELVNNLVNRIFRWHGAPCNLDFLGRFGRDEMFRLFELEKVVAGDAGLLKLADLKLQAIESDLIAQGVAEQGGTKAPDGVNSSGLLLDSMGRVEQYCICRRGDNGGKPIFAHMEPRGNIIFDGYWSRFSSQLRGVSPLTTAINMVQDTYEAFEFNIVKAKMHALFGVAITRDADPDSGAMGGAAGATAETEDATATATGTHQDLNPRAINMLDMGPGEKPVVIESTTPSSQFVEGSYLFIQVAMLALDIPITSFDSRRSSFSARIADLNEYEVSSDAKRTKNRYVRQDYSNWLLRSIWNDPASPWLLRSTCEANGMDLRDVQEAAEWVASGSPWLDKYKQVQGDELAINIKLDNPIDAARRRGADVFVNIDKAIKVEVYERDRRALAKLPPKAAPEGGLDATLKQTIEGAVARTMEAARDDEGGETGNE